ncbi:MAG: c-type cytochrome [Thalassotalea sp.]|nr:c-type cytochrome [Thalassotalea sp.]
MLKICLTLNQKLSALITASLLFAFSSFGYTNEVPQVYSQCVACHGDKAQGNAQLNSPALAGFSAEYITRQLQNFSSGVRGSHEKDTLGQQMLAISKSLDMNKDVPALSAYIESLPPVSAAPETSGNLMNGSRYYQGKCGACHGGKAEGNPAFKAPKLAGQNVDYLRRQMQNFVNGVRGTHAEDKLGRQMAMMAKTTSGKELEDILHYISEQQIAPQK